MPRGEVADALKAAYGTAADQAAQLLRQAGYAVNEVALALSVGYGLAVGQIAQLLKTSWLWLRRHRCCAARWTSGWRLRSWPRFSIDRRGHRPGRRFPEGDLRPRPDRSWAPASGHRVRGGRSEAVLRDPRPGVRGSRQASRSDYVVGSRGQLTLGSIDSWLRAADANGRGGRAVGGSARQTGVLGAAGPGSGQRVRAGDVLGPTTAASVELAIGRLLRELRPPRLTFSPAWRRMSPPCDRRRDRWHRS